MFWVLVLRFSSKKCFFGHPCGFFYPMLENANFCMGVHPPRRGRVGLRKLALHITFALHLCISFFLYVGEFCAEFGPVSALLRQSWKVDPREKIGRKSTLERSKIT